MIGAYGRGNTLNEIRLERWAGLGQARPYKTRQNFGLSFESNGTHLESF